MTIVELSEFIKIPSRTVFHWAKKASAKVSDKMAHAKTHNKAADLTMAECIEVVKAGGNYVLADFMEASAGAYGKAFTTESHGSNGCVTSVTRPKLPNGKQMEVLYRAAKDKLMTAIQFQEAIGVTVPQQGQFSQLAAPEPHRLSADVVAAELRSLIPPATKAMTKADEAANFVRGRVIAKETGRIVQDRLNHHLPFGSTP